MRHALILAHPNPASFTAAMAGAYGDALRALGEEVILRDLYAMDFDPRLRVGELPGLPGFSPAPDVVAERERLVKIDVFTFFYPLWFNGPPAILKGYVDRVMGAGFGFEPAAGGSEPRLFGRQLVSFTASGAPDRWVQRTQVVEHLRSGFEDHLAAVCGLAHLEHKHFAGIVPGIRPDAVEDMLEEVRAVARRMFAPAAG